MSKKLSQQQLQEIRTNFDYFDKDNNGAIDQEEFTQLLKVIEPSTKKEQAEQGFKLIDSDNNGTIELDEFIDWWQSYWWHY